MSINQFNDNIDGYFSLISFSCLVKGTWLKWTLGRLKAANPVLKAYHLSVRDLVSQVLPEMSELGEWLLDHVSVRLVADFLQQQLPLVAQLLHVNLLLVHLHLVLLLRARQEGGRKGRREGDKDVWENKKRLGLCKVRIII